jgi:hypothetical protein
MSFFFLACPIKKQRRAPAGHARFSSSVVLKRACLEGFAQSMLFRFCIASSACLQAGKGR